MPQEVKLDNLASAIMDALKEYGAHSDVVVEAAVNAAGKDCVDEIRANAPERPNGGRYKKSWRGKAETPAPHRYTYTAYANKDGYRIAHLLENGHLNRDGSRTRAFPHIRPAEKKAEEELIRRLKKEL